MIIVQNIIDTNAYILISNFSGKSFILLFILVILKVLFY